jgi:transcriptional regulator with XRE-family HTH domain
MNFPEYLRRKIKYSGYTQQYVAEQIGVSATTVYYWASNRARPTVKHLVQLEKLLSCQPGELFVALAYGAADEAW